MEVAVAVAVVVAAFVPPRGGDGGRCVGGCLSALVGDGGVCESLLPNNVAKNPRFFSDGAPFEPIGASRHFASSTASPNHAAAVDSSESLCVDEYESCRARVAAAAEERGPPAEADEAAAKEDDVGSEPPLLLVDEVLLARLRAAMTVFEFACC